MRRHVAPEYVAGMRQRRPKHHQCPTRENLRFSHREKDQRRWCPAQQARFGAVDAVGGRPTAPSRNARLAASAAPVTTGASAARRLDRLQSFIALRDVALRCQCVAVSSAGISYKYRAVFCILIQKSVGEIDLQPSFSGCFSGSGQPHRGCRSAFPISRSNAAAEETLSSAAFLRCPLVTADRPSEETL